MLVIPVECRDKLNEAMAFASENGFLEAFLQQLLYLGTYANGDGCTFDKRRGKDTRCTLYADRSPFSFDFSMEKKESPQGDFERWFGGGLIYHGPVPAAADNGVPALTVELAGGDAPHWGVHT